MTFPILRALALGAALAALTATAAAAKGEGLMAMLNGANERPAPTDSNAVGRATVLLDVAQSRVCYTLSVKNLARATMAHIHKGGADVSGPVVVPLAAPDTHGSKGCVAADAAVVKDIADNPAGYYVNVHTTQFPAGAIRGQLGK